jgi:hypothetical protein
MNKRFLVISIFVVAVLTVVAYFYFTHRPNLARGNKFREWIRNPLSHTDWKIAACSQCGSAPFRFPTDGFVGFLWGDSMGWRHIHQGIDIFAGTNIGITRVISAYPGYLTRLPEWKSAVIVRVPDDPLKTGRQIWLYYAHMADEHGNSFISADFPPGTYDAPVAAGTFLGYQGDYSDDPSNPVGVHLHFSIVKDDDAGKFRNELDINNTLDPSPYLGLPLNGNENRDRVPLCEASSE